MAVESNDRRRRLIVVAGRDQSGKSSLAAILETFGYRVFECGEFARQYIGVDRGAALSHAYESRMTDINTKIIDFLKSNNIEQNIESLVVVGVRSAELFSMIISSFLNPPISIFVDCPIEIRFARHIKDRRTLCHLTYDEFLINDEMQTNWGVEVVRSQCAFVIKNDSTIADLSQKITEILRC